MDVYCSTLSYLYTQGSELWCMSRDMSDFRGFVILWMQCSINEPYKYTWKVKSSLFCSDRTWYLDSFFPATFHLVARFSRLKLPMNMCYMCYAIVWLSWMEDFYWSDDLVNTISSILLFSSSQGARVHLKWELDVNVCRIFFLRGRLKPIWFIWNSTILVVTSICP